MTAEQMIYSLACFDCGRGWTALTREDCPGCGKRGVVTGSFYEWPVGVQAYIKPVRFAGPDDKMLED